MRTKQLITAIAFGFIGMTTLQAQDKTDHSGHDHAKMEKAETVHACPMKCEGEKTYAEPGDCPKCGMALTKVEVKKEAKEFYCPMKCEGEKTYSENKGCPKCGMALVEKKVKKEEDDHSGHKH